MELLWRYDLPTEETSQDYQFAGPVLIKDEKVFFLTPDIREVQLHVVEATSGREISVHKLPCMQTVTARNYLLLDIGRGVLVYAGGWDFWQDGAVSPVASMMGKGKLLEHLRIGDSLYLVCAGRETKLLRLDLDTLCIRWEIDISNTKHYGPGSLWVCDGKLSCYGRDALLFLDMESGDICARLKLPRIDKLFCPVVLPGGQLLMGYTNWTNAGILRYDLVSGKILWRHKRKFEGPQNKCRIYPLGDRVIWVKNGTELICLDIESGEECYSLRTDPWLYTELHEVGGQRLYGTAGADGYLTSLDPVTGQKTWSVFFKEGCEYFALYGDTVLAGDYGKTVKQISLSDGKILDEISLDGEVVGRMKVDGTSAYTVVWGDENRDIQLVKIRIQEELK